MSKQNLDLKNGPKVFHLENDCERIAIAVKYPYVYHFDRDGILRSDLLYNLSPWSLKNLYFRNWHVPKLVYNFVIGDISSHKVLKKAADRMVPGDSVEVYFQYAAEENEIHKKNKELGKFIRKITEPTIKTKKGPDGTEQFWSASLKVYIHDGMKKDPIVYFSTREADIIRIARRKLASCKGFERFDLDVASLPCDMSFSSDHVYIVFKNI